MKVAADVLAAGSDWGVVVRDGGGMRECGGVRVRGCESEGVRERGGARVRGAGEGQCGSELVGFESRATARLIDMSARIATLSRSIRTVRVRVRVAG